jgi:hypothetical protein
MANVKQTTDAAGQAFQLGDFVLPGISLIGSGISAAGAAYQAEKDRASEEKRFREQMALENRKQGFNEQATGRELGMKGIGVLSDMRNEAIKSARGRVFRDGVLAALSGGR